MRRSYSCLDVNADAEGLVIFFFFVFTFTCQGVLGFLLSGDSVDLGPFAAHMNFFAERTP
jgi:hypothetical protein